MRRPVKPFVTEYRGSSRRAKDGRPEEDRAKGAASGAIKGATKGGGSAKPRGPEAQREYLAPRDLFRTVPDAGTADGYEAALRAADALFSPRPDIVAPVRRPLAAMAHADAAATGAAAEVGEAGEPTGRVLRALDEPATKAPTMFPDEAAPKRRGRKPGSVNRPKPSPAAGHGSGAPARLTAQAAVEAPANGLAVRDSDAAPPAAGGDALHRTASAAVSRNEAAASGTSEPARSGRDAAAVIAMRREKRREPFAWVRTKLGPGEKWKRRLPKVAW